MRDCLFCLIVAKQVPSKMVYEDEHIVAFDDINPQAPTHILVVPRKHIAGLNDMTAEDAALVGRMHLVAAELAQDRGIEQGYRTVFNTGRGAGQSVFHLHLHLLGGRPMRWPPG